MKDDASWRPRLISYRRRRSLTRGASARPISRARPLCRTSTRAYNEPSPYLERADQRAAFPFWTTKKGRGGFLFFWFWGGAFFFFGAGVFFFFFELIPIRFFFKSGLRLGLKERRQKKKQQQQQQQQRDSGRCPTTRATSLLRGMSGRLRSICPLPLPLVARREHGRRAPGRRSSSTATSSTRLRAASYFFAMQPTSKARAVSQTPKYLSDSDVFRFEAGKGSFFGEREGSLGKQKKRIFFCSLTQKEKRKKKKEKRKKEKNGGQASVPHRQPYVPQPHAY